MIESKCYKDAWNDETYTRTIDQLTFLAEHVPIIWCDQGDSSGVFLGQVVPIVHKYLKAQLLKDLRLYQSKHYGARIYTDYYHKKNNIIDEKDFATLPLIKDEHVKKLALSWNSGLMNYGAARPYLMKLWSVLPFQPFLDFSKTITPPQAKRDLALSCRMGISYPRATVRYQRERLRELLRAYIKTDKISHGAYLREIQTSKISLSPFGYGEITLKDFETFLCGAALLKPHMEHMTTWPHFYEPWKTYVPFSWDLQDVEDVIDRLLSDHEQRLSIAAEGQRVYVEHTTGQDAAALFVNHFKNLVTL
ncbi:MAG: glycosyltransferase [Alphaproteobacteria bacterium]|nr:glycosyltransferase [Alphaproteobacteria bacterium]